MVVNNISKFPWVFKGGEHYFIQILDRNRSASGNNNRCIKAYFISTKEELDEKLDEIMKIAKATNSRVYMHPARRDKKALAIDLLRYVVACVTTRSIARLRRCYETVAGRNIGTEKMRIVDIDTKDQKIIDETIDHIAIIRPFRRPFKMLETVDGYHAIYQGGFDRDEYYRTRIHKWDVHTNNPTILYAEQ